MCRIKNILVLMLFFGIIVTSIVAAENIALVVELPDGILKQECVNVPKQTSAYDILGKSHLDLTWSSPSLYGHALCKIEGYGNEVSGTNCVWGNESWAFFIYDKNSQQWKYSSVGYDVPGGCGFHYCAVDGDILGWVLTSYDNNWAPNNQPPLSEFQSICGLSITGIDAVIDGEKERNLENGAIIREKAKPGSSVEFDVEASNLFSSSQNIKIEDAVLKITVEGIDYGEDLEIESETFSIGEGRSKKVKLDFNIPVLVDESDYKVLIELEGDGSDRINYKDDAELVLNVKKERHSVKILEFSFLQPVVSCERTVEANVQLANLGREDEEVSLEIKNDVLGTVAMQRSITLPEGDSEKSIYSKSLLLDFGNATPGRYAMNATITYDNGEKSDSKQAEILIEACAEEIKNGLEQEKSEQKETAVNKTLTGAEAATGMVVVQQSSPTQTYALKADVISYDKKITVLIVAAIILILFLGIFAILLIKRK